MNFKNLSKAVLVIALAVGSAMSYADEWKMIDRYQVKAGLAKDTSTGLMWMRCSLGQNWYGLFGHGICQGDTAKYTWLQAMNTPKNFMYAGYSDWRIPTHEELKSLVHCISGKTIKTADGGTSCDGNDEQPAILDSVFPNVTIFQYEHWWSGEGIESVFWSSSSHDSKEDEAWVVDFIGGGSDNYYRNKSDNYGVRLVRAGK